MLCKSHSLMILLASQEAVASFHALAAILRFGSRGWPELFWMPLGKDASVALPIKASNLLLAPRSRGRTWGSPSSTVLTSLGAAWPSRSTLGP